MHTNYNELYNSYTPSNKKIIIFEGLNINELGTKIWIKNNVLHRINGPAVMHRNGECCYWNNGSIHREDGPAFISDYMTQWVYKDKEIHCTSLKDFKRQIKLLVFK
jgi:hypothetical protein